MISKSNPNQGGGVDPKGAGGGSKTSTRNFDEVAALKTRIASLEDALASTRSEAAKYRTERNKAHEELQGLNGKLEKAQDRFKIHEMVRKACEMHSCDVELVGGVLDIKHGVYDLDPGATDTFTKIAAHTRELAKNKPAVRIQRPVAIGSSF